MRRTLLAMVVTIITFSTGAIAQDYSRNSIKTGIGIGMNEGFKETGLGTFASFGFQRSFWNDRLRIGPELMAGGFFPIGITDTRDQYYRVTTIGVSGNLDVIKYKSFSLFLGAGGQINYSRGLLGTGGFPEEGNSTSEYFFKLYYGGCFSGGFRIDPPDSRIAYVITPLTICFGNEYFVNGLIKIGIDIKLNKKK